MPHINLVFVGLWMEDERCFFVSNEVKLLCT